MNIKPIPAPLAQSQGESASRQSATARAIAAFGNNAPPPVDPNSISPEEMGAIVAPTRAAEEVEDLGQKTSSEATETVAEEPAPKVEDPLSSQYAQLARRERAIRAKAQQQEQAFRTREEALKARESALQSQDQQYKSGYISKDQLRLSPLEALAEAGLSYEELTQQLLTQQPKDPRIEAHISRLEAQIKSLEAANETSKSSATAQQQAAYNAAVSQIRSDAKTLVAADPAFETIKYTNSVDDVVDLITQTWEKDEILLSVQDAAQQVEDYLVEEAMKLTKIEKIKKRLSPPAATPKAPQTQTPAVSKQTQPMKTLTNASASTRQLSAKERAILAFKGELK